MIEIPSAIAAAAPTLYILLVSLVFFLAAAWAVTFSEDDPASERHFAYAAAMTSVLVVLVASIVVRACGAGWAVPDDAAAQRYAMVWTGIWTVGSLMLAARLAIGWVSTRVICRGAEALADQELQKLVEFCRRELRVPTRPRVLVSRASISPFVTGIGRPTIVLTPAFMEADPRAQRLIMLHEFAHIRRHDCLVELLLQVLGVFMWWNPLYWIARGHMTSLREVACDEMVVSRTTHKAAYMALIASLCKLRPALAGQSFSTVHMASSATLMIRLKELDGGLRVYPRYLPASMPQRLSRRGLTVWLGGAIVLCLFVDQFGTEIANAMFDATANERWQSVADGVYQ